MDMTRFLPPDPSAPPILDLAKCKRLVELAPVAMRRMPNSDMYGEMATQMKLLLEEHTNTSSIISAAKSDAVRFEREAQMANNDLAVTRTQLADARTKIDELTKACSCDKTPAQEQPVKRKPGRPARIVEMPQSKEAAQ
ncbi:MAG: hypothetical protein KKD77_23540 [Gammaproteobacteria bacterium]|nr:hypothetical protein [Gammaproteobacteria bacterium]